MKKEEKLVNKLKRLLRRLKVPRYLHRFGPKTYEFYEHLQALLIKVFCKLTYRRIKQLLDLLGIRCPSKSALHYTTHRISSALWQKMLELTSSGRHYLVALDSTGFSRINPSYYYLRRINGAMPKIPVKLSCTFDTRKKKFCAAKHFRLRTYHRRELIESGNSALKRKYGTSVSSRSAQMIRAELYLRLNCNNLFLKIIEI